MTAPKLVPTYDEFLEFVIEKATPEAILSFKLSESAQGRAIELLDRQDADELTPEEAHELQEMARFDRIITLLKARALTASRAQ